LSFKSFSIDVKELRQEEDEAQKNKKLAKQKKEILVKRKQSTLHRKELLIQ
jgi:hypothetical protein